MKGGKGGVLATCVQNLKSVSCDRAKLATENGMDVIQIVDTELGKERPTALDSRNVQWSMLAADAVNLRCNHENLVDESSDSMLFAEIQPATQISFLGACFRGFGRSKEDESDNG